MSSKNRGRRNREKKEFTRDEDQEIGVIDDPNDPSNKIEHKQRDVFDAHLYQENLLQRDSHARNNHLLDFEDEEPPKPEPKQELTEEEPKKRDVRKRARREKKTIVASDEEDIKEEPEPQLSELASEIPQETNGLMRFESPPKQEDREEQEEKEEREEVEEESESEQDEGIKMRELAAKKEGQKASDMYVMMHSIMNRAGFNKQQRRRAIYAPLEPGQHSFVYFKRYQSGFSEYYQAIGEDQRPILFCENQRGCIGCNYYISLTKEMDKNNPAYLGKLRGNAAGSLYQLYDNGLQPSNNMDRSKFRVNMAYIEYESNFLGMKGPRKLKAIVPNAKTLEDFDMYKFSEEETLDNLQGGPVIRLRNKQPRWNERLKSYALNFGGRVKQASIKNFILMEDRYDENSEEKAPNVIIFGKVDENTFSLEFRHPLSLYQAFGISMSEFDFKLKCE